MHNDVKKEIINLFKEKKSISEIQDILKQDGTNVSLSELKELINGYYRKQERKEAIEIKERLEDLINRERAAGSPEGFAVLSMPVFDFMPLKF